VYVAWGQEGSRCIIHSYDRPGDCASSARNLLGPSSIRDHTDTVHKNRVAMTVALYGANRPKLVMITASQKTSTTKNGVGMAPPICCKNSERVRPVGELQGAAAVGRREGSIRDEGQGSQKLRFCFFRLNDGYLRRI
jgi:hypothetical protein